MLLVPLADNVEKRHLPVATTLILALNLLVFAFEMRLHSEDFKVSPDGKKKVRIDRKTDNFFKMFGLSPKDLEEGRWYPLATHMFVHGGFAHIFGNMLMLWIFAVTVESALGGFAFACLYMIWGVAAAVAQSLGEWGSDIPMIGASGAIAGVLGAYFVAFGARTKIKTFLWFIRPMVVQIPAVAFLLFWFVTQLMSWAEEGKRPGHQSGVAWMAHIGGFIAGAALMALIQSQTQRRLVRDKSGDLVFVEAEHAAKVGEKAPVDWKPQSGAAAPVVDVKKCTYCGQPFAESDFIAANLAKCPDVNCQRLSYMT